MFSFLIKAFNREKRLTELEETVQTMKDERKRILLEWEDTYEKFRLLYVRLSKRVKQMEQAPEREDTQPGESGVLVEGTTPSLLSPRAQEAQRKILARRGKVVGM